MRLDKIKPLTKFRLISHNFAGLLATVGTYLMLLAIINYPILLSNAFQTNLYILYLALYPVLMALVIIEDIIFLIHMHKKQFL